MRKSLLCIAVLGWLCAVPVAAKDIELAQNAPERYVVVKGDTLWDIAAQFLTKPWRWPEIWDMNRDQIKDPHWIYPGDVILLDRSGVSPELRLMQREIHKLSPSVRVEPTTTTAIPSIPLREIGPFLSRPLVSEKDDMVDAAFIVAIEENRVIAGTGNRAYVKGVPDNGPLNWQVYEQGKAMIDPDNKEVLGYEAIYLGDARVTKYGQPATVEITKAMREIHSGNRVIPAPPDAPVLAYVPHAPEREVQGRIIAVYGGVAEVGTNSIVSISRGRKDGIEEGNVLALYRAGESVKPRSFTDLLKGSQAVPVVLPEERYGLVFVFRVFERVSYALVVQTSRQVNIVDIVKNP
ncbi:MAG: LysM peptidoglycan-binding domain-containing protein [Burkholderiales bacterium]